MHRYFGLQESLIVTMMVVLAAPVRAQESTCTVESITDGDTIRCGGERVRLLSIEPERRHDEGA